MANLHPSVFSIMTQLLSSGMPFDIASGFVGNMMVENMYNPTRGFQGHIESPPDDEGKFALGLNQWRGARQDKLRSFQEMYGLPVDDLSGQVRFMLEELKDSDYKDPTSFQKYKDFMNLYNQGVFTDIGGITEALEKAYYRADPRTIPNFDPTNADHRSQLNTYLNSLKMRRDKAKMINDLGANFFGGNNNNLPPNPNKKASLISQLTGGLGGLLGGGNDGINWGGLAMGLNAMSLNPDPSLNQAIALRQENQKEANQLAQGRKRILQYVNSMPAGPLKDQYLAMVQSNVDPKDIYSDMLKNRQNLFSQEGQLRNEFNKKGTVVDYDNMIPFYNQLVKFVEKGDPAKDVAIVFRFMKLLDPESSVREQEQATARDLGGVPAWVGAMYNRLLGQGELTQDQRNSILNTSRIIMLDAQKGFQREVDAYTSFIQDNYPNIRMDTVITDRGLDQQAWERGEALLGYDTEGNQVEGGWSKNRLLIKEPPKLLDMLPPNANSVSDVNNVILEMVNAGIISREVYNWYEEQYDGFKLENFNEMWKGQYFNREDKRKIKAFLKNKFPSFDHSTYFNID